MARTSLSTAPMPRRHCFCSPGSHRRMEASPPKQTED
ncbi:uncharacterized protein PpBr36_10822 [Pyricularia pennisetigena]|nr:uncharacterized protein PpBr36_10822 [Pyricularia pennisetigena]TLS21001.1 hypothetical protein PpBr36_10822 [Pyricularia pennisetigena]